MLGRNDIECPNCRKTRKARERIRLRRHLDNKATMIARRDAILSGKVEVLYLRDDITGFYYRQNKQGQIVTGGRGDRT